MELAYNKIDMNIQQYITTEMLLSLVVVGTMALVYLLFRLTGRMHNTSFDNVLEEEYRPRVNSGQFWYERTGPFQPFINKETKPIKILEFRADEFSDWGWARGEQDGKEVIISVDALVESFMKDDFNDIRLETVKKAEPELDIEIEFEQKKESKPTGNILTLDGKDYVLAPV